MPRILAALLACLAVSFAAHAYEPKPITELLDQDVGYDETIPTPEDVLGRRSGEIIFTPEMLHEYVRAVAAASDRVSVETIGRSHFGRPILRVTTTSPENQARLEEIRAAHLAALDPDAGPRDADAPTIVQITHGVHGAEASGYDASAPLLYFLAAAQGEEIDALLDRVVVHQVVLINPDGANRFAEWTNMHRAQVPVADPQHREHFFEWPWGRTNHYWFDLNRQWLPVTQPEAEALVNSTHHWAPNVALDMHEMGSNSTFFFSPGPVDGLHPLLSQAGLELNLEMNEFLADQLDSEGALYVSEEFFDDFYLGYGSSYPGLLGSVPYLFEQSSVRGIIQETERGVLRYDDKVGQQARVAIALIRAADANREALLDHQQTFFAESLRLADADPVRAYVFTSNDRGRLADFLELMAVHRIEVRELSQQIRLDGITFEPGEAFVVPTRQRNYRVLKGIFETRVITDETEFYDVSGWTQPLAYDLDYAEVRAGLFAPNITGEPVTGFEAAAAAPAQSDLAYVMEWDHFHAPRALYRALDAGLHARVIPDAITLDTPAGQVSPGRGAVVIPVIGQEIDAGEIHALMTRAAEDGVTVHAATSALTPAGSDLGGFDLSNVEKPEILLVTGRVTSSYDAGEMWHLLDFEMRMPVSMIDARELGGADLDRYTHIILPNGRYDSALGESGAERLGEWASDGGVLIAMRGGARFVVEHELADVRFTSDASDEEAEAVTAEPRPYDDFALWETEHGVSGAILETEIDVTHPLGFGYRDPVLPVHKIGTDAFAAGDNPFALPARYADEPLLSGYASQRNREALAGAGSVFAERRGEGSVILFADDPYFRAYFRGTAKMVMNAIFFGNDFRNPSRRGD
ncbi:carboxypeptidase [Marinicauda salina]|uniref:Carboxypeptidase n=1 Tax=Marinicauda salina TaxID=2135793 RepID=A0A2U2BV96_9PROT|nr:M14 family zinc carboxypeptidase [Marinicauda salina]PWE17938.1 carboxypeptidase [Marinicauda salina]